MKKTVLFTKKVSKKLEFIRDNRWQGESFYVKVEKEGGFSPVQFQNEPRNSDLKWNDKNLQLITLFRFWNIINYFYPYKYLMDKNWDTVLLETVPKFKNFESETDFHWQINLLVAKLNDSHGSFFSELIVPMFRGKYHFLSSLKIIDDKLVLTKINNDSLAVKNDVKVGDVISKIDNETVLEIINKKKNNFSYSNNATLLRTIDFIATIGNSETFEAEYERNGITTKRFLNRYNYHEALLNTFQKNYKKYKTEKFPILEKNIGCIILERLKETEVDSMFTKFRNTKAIIFDIRNYPRISEDDLLPYIIKKDSAFVKQTFADTNYPGRFIFEKPYEGTFTPKKGLIKYSGKIIVLVNENTQSHAEWVTMCLRSMKNSTVIGSQTAGADGGVSSYEIINTLPVTFTGKGVYYPDGRETQRIGIIPDIEVKPTIAGIKLGKDEVLDRALLFIETGK